MFESDLDISPKGLYEAYTENFIWNLFLTSTALHAILLIASPLQAVLKWFRRKSSDGDTCLPYVCAVIGSAFWLRYAIFIRDTKLVLLQTYAVAMQLSFLLLLLFYRSKRTKLTRALCLIILSMFLFLNHVQDMNEEDGKKFIGWIASTAQIAGSLVCPYLVLCAIKARVIDFIPFFPVFFTCLLELHAIVYAIGINDFYLLLANSVFCFNDSLLLSMFFIFPTTSPRRSKTYEV